MRRRGRGRKREGGGAAGAAREEKGTVRRDCLLVGGKKAEKVGASVEGG
jgi:hypothetical protein